MAYVLLARPTTPVVGNSSEIPVASGTLAAMRDKRTWWEEHGEVCRIVRSRDGKEVA